MTTRNGTRNGIVRISVNPFRLSTHNRKLFCLKMYRRWLDLVTSPDTYDLVTSQDAPETAN